MQAKILTWTAVIVLSMTLGGAAVVAIDELRSDDAGLPAVISQSVPSTSSDVSIIEDVSGLYAQVRPSIVTISGTSSRTGASGVGSGIVLDEEGRILTNNHVVRGFDSIDVTLSNGESYAARVLGADPGNDLAVIEIDAPSDQLQTAVLGDSDSIEVGELVIAVGNPLNLAGSVTQGIVSGLGRTLNDTGGSRPLRQLIQSDAAINPGNSGGALFNKNGEVIGVTTAIDNSDGERAFAGIGYSVPVNTAKRFLPDMLAGRTVQHPKMGIGLRELTPALARSLGIDVEDGVQITQVETNSAAARAGLRGGTGVNRSTVGDVITAIDDKEIRSFEDLANYIDTKKVGDQIEVKVVRDGNEVTISLTLEAWQG
jgi:S1-C subfamily serine protease